MAERKDIKSKVRSHSRVFPGSHIYYKTGPVVIKPVQNIMFELDTRTGTQRKIGSPKDEHINKGLALVKMEHQSPLSNASIKSQEVAKTPTNIGQMNHHGVDKASLRMEHSCPEFGKALTNIGQMNHQGAGQAPFSCHELGKAPTPTNIGQMNHQGASQAPFSCHELGKVPTPTNIGQMNHKGVGQAPFSCHELGKAPTYIGQVNHQRVGQAPFSCHELGKAPNNIGQINRHAPLTMEHISCPELTKAPSNIGPTLNHQELCKAPAKTGPMNSRVVSNANFNIINGVSKPMSFGSFTLAQLDSEEVKATNIEPRYNAGVLQGNWLDDRLHPKYKPLHPPPLHTCNLDYRSTYKDAFLNHNLKDVASVMPVKKDNSLPPWIVNDEVGPCKKIPASNEGHTRTTRQGYDGKDPHKGNDLDPFKRRDQYRTGFEYKLDAFQEDPSRWEKYRGREAYFKRKERGDRCSSTGEALDSAGLVMSTADPSQAPAQASRGDDKAQAPLIGQDTIRPNQPQAPDLRHMGPTRSNQPQLPDKAQAPVIGQDTIRSNQPQLPDKAQAPVIGQDTIRPNQPQAPDIRHMGPTRSNQPQLPDKTQAPVICQDTIRPNQPQAPDIRHMGPTRSNQPQLPDKTQARPVIGRRNPIHPNNTQLPYASINPQLEADLRKLNRAISTEYKASYKPTGNDAAMSVAKRKERERTFAAARNISTLVVF